MAGTCDVRICVVLTDHSLVALCSCTVPEHNGDEPLFTVTDCEHCPWSCGV